ncbi:TPA: hypothetical protein ACOFC4_000245 [Stenotrophomonas maltophilia]
MSEIISFPVRMRFTTFRAFDIRSGLGDVIAVFWGPEQRLCRYGHCGEQQDAHPAVAELKAATSQPIAAMPGCPTMPCNREG